MLRYSYSNQPTVMWWNMVKLGEAMAELLGSGNKANEATFIEKGLQDVDIDKAVALAEKVVENAGKAYKEEFLHTYKNLMSQASLVSSAS